MFSQEKARWMSQDVGLRCSCDKEVFPRSWLNKHVAHTKMQTQVSQYSWLQNEMHSYLDTYFLQKSKLLAAPPLNLWIFFHHQLLLVPRFRRYGSLSAWQRPRPLYPRRYCCPPVSSPVCECYLCPLPLSRGGCIDPVINTIDTNIGIGIWRILARWDRCLSFRSNFSSSSCFI